MFFIYIFITCQTLVIAALVAAMFKRPATAEQLSASARPPRPLTIRRRAIEWLRLDSDEVKDPWESLMISRPFASCAGIRDDGKECRSITEISRPEPGCVIWKDLDERWPVWVCPACSRWEMGVCGPCLRILSGQPMPPPENKLALCCYPCRQLFANRPSRS